jgi:hypothetical protein
MIQAHRFHFIDQPELQAEYESFGFAKSTESGVETIEVQEVHTYAGFHERSVLMYLSARACYYLANTSFGKLSKEDDWGLEIVDVLTLVWEGRDKRILYGRGKYFTPELLRFWIFHTFFPLVLELRREYKMLHVGAVEIAGGPVFFSAPSYGGKSTMTDYFIQKGHTLYADDTLPVRRENGHYIAYPSFPYHRPYRQPETLGYRVDNFAKEPAPLKALFELESAPPDADITIVSPTGIERFKSCFYSAFIKFSFMKKERFDFFSKMAMEVPVYKVTVPWDLKRLDEVYEAIIRKVEEL